jgi:hypothetical protein
MFCLHLRITNLSLYKHCRGAIYDCDIFKVQATVHEVVNYDCNMLIVQATHTVVNYDHNMLIVQATVPIDVNYDHNMLIVQATVTSEVYGTSYCRYGSKLRLQNTYLTGHQYWQIFFQF